LRITRVRDWSICFNYDGKHYLLHGTSEAGEGSWQELYERELDEYGRYKLTFISNKYGDDYVAYDYIKRQKGRTIVYSLVDKDFFVYKLTKRGFATGTFEDEVTKQNEEILKLRAELKMYEDKCRDIRNKINTLS
jgi:hypothetical protein